MYSDCFCDVRGGYDSSFEKYSTISLSRNTALKNTVERKKIFTLKYVAFEFVVTLILNSKLMPTI